MDTDALTDALEASGLPPYQAAAYVSLLELRSAVAGEVARESGVPQPRIYDVLRDLEAAGHVELFDDGTLHARVHDPSSMLDTVRSKATRYETASEVIQREYRRQPESHAGATVVKQFETVCRRTRTAVADATALVQLCLSPEAVVALEPVLSAARDRGVTVELSLHSVEAADVEPDEYRHVCSTLRTRRLPAPFLAIVDSTVVRFALHVGTRNEYGLLVDDRTHAGLFRWYFLTTLWEGWDEHYTVEGDESAVYWDIRRCVADLRPALDAGAKIRVQVDGHEVETGRALSFSGVVREVRADGSDDGPRLVQQNGQVTVVVDTGTRTYTVGGLNAVVEEVRATCVSVVSLRQP